MRRSIVVAVACVAVSGCVVKKSTKNITSSWESIAKVKADGGKSWIVVEEATRETTLFYETEESGPKRLVDKSDVTTRKHVLWLCADDGSGRPVCERAQWGGVSPKRAPAVIAPPAAPGPTTNEAGPAPADVQIE
jgi:hypothetical protein